MSDTHFIDRLHKLKSELTELCFEYYELGDDSKLRKIINCRSEVHNTLAQFDDFQLELIRLDK